MKRLLIASACLSLLMGCSKKNEFQPPPPPEVGVQHPAQESVTVYDEFPGRLAARDSVEIRARVKGYLKSVEFTDGQRVKKGDLLFTIEPDQYLAAVKASEAELAQARAALQLAEATLKRNAQAFKTKAISEVDMLTAEAQKESAAGAVTAAQAALDNAKLNLEYTKILAPLDGRISRRAMSVGNLVGDSGSTFLALLVAEAPIDVYFNAAERDALPYLKDGVKENPGTTAPPVKLELADGQQHDEEGSIDYIDPEVDPDTGTLTMRAVFPNRNVNLLPGLYGKILIPHEVSNAILVPDLAVQRDMSGFYVLTVTPENTVENRYIKRGALVGDRRIVQDGLTAEDRVIVQGIQKARPGITVRVAAPAE